MGAAGRTRNHPKAHMAKCPDASLGLQRFHSARSAALTNRIYLQAELTWPTVRCSSPDGAFSALSGFPLRSPVSSRLSQHLPGNSSARVGVGPEKSMKGVSEISVFVPFLTILTLGCVDGPRVPPASDSTRPPVNEDGFVSNTEEITVHVPMEFLHEWRLASAGHLVLGRQQSHQWKA